MEPQQQQPSFRPRILYFVIFDRSGKLLFYRAWGSDARIDPAAIDEHAKLIFGVCFSYKQLIPSLSRDPDASLRSLTTSGFTLHVFESATGFRFVLGTFVASTKQQAEVQAFLHDFYATSFVDLVMQDPVYEPGSKIFSQQFVKVLDLKLEKLFTS